MKMQLIDSGLKKATQQFLCAFAPVIAGSAIAALPFLPKPAQAATFAASGSYFEITNFSIAPTGIATDTFTDAVSIAANGEVVALAEAEATFIVEPTIAFNFSTAIAAGSGTNYLGIAQSQAQVIGDFQVAADSIFSFDFFTVLGLAAFTNNRGLENAHAAGTSSFFLLDNTDPNNQSLLDFFSISLALDTARKQTVFNFDFSPNVALTKTQVIQGGTISNRFAYASVTGSVERYFAESTNLQLVEFKANQAVVKTPDPLGAMGLFMFVTGAGLAGKLKPTKRPV